MTKVVVVVLLASLLAGCTDFGDDSGLDVTGVDVAAPEVGAGRLTLAVLPTIDNGGGRSGPLNLSVKAYDGQTGLLTASTWQEAGRLERHQTRTFEIRLDLPRAAAYRLAVGIEEGGRLVYQATLDARNLANLEPNTHETGLRIVASDFRLLGVANERATVQASIYLTNEGASDSRPLTLQVRAREESTLLVVAEQWTGVASIRPEATRPINVTLDVPTGRDYAVEVTLWEGEIIVERGSGRIQFGPTSAPAPPTGVVVSTPTLNDLVFDRANGGQHDSSASKSPGLGIVAVLGAVAGLAVLLRRRLE